MTDRIFIEELHVRCLIGINDEEREKKQDVYITIELETDLRKAGASDEFADAVDYRGLKKRVFRMAEESKFKLVEALAERVAAMCLEDPRVEAVRVRLDKPGALRFARNVGVDITRRRGE